ncbi:MAG: glycosyltransferase family 2 protein [Candidatus Diapherotrites archaeon]|uniref:Glycosyltransferase family 2 protein n=1 Tax=Candidatus Iainarchaeum sp. TaxID=3101447 RepID=A0A8T4C5E8_9ARCH|nr:glycosyltransferase family 2 protein [Candidatus Diapherotrites archaeon]
MSIPRKLPTKVKLVVTIPAYNEESTIVSVINSIPSVIEGVHDIRILVVDDGSSDQTAARATKAGARVVSNAMNRGLAYTFSRGLEEALGMGADIIVNTDADNQYDQSQIPQLIQPILNRQADMVLGSRFKGHIEDMSFSKRWGNQLASRVVKWVSGLNISDGQTGFRAFTRDAALRLNIFSSFTYTQETILEAADKKMRVVEIPCTFRKRADKNRLFAGVFDYARRAIMTLVVGALKYHPIKTFGYAGIGLVIIGGIIGLPVAELFWSTGSVGPFTLRAIATGIFFILGFQLIFLGFIAELLKHNRQIAERQLVEAKRARLDNVSRAN